MFCGGGGGGAQGSLWTYNEGYLQMYGPSHDTTFDWVDGSWSVTYFQGAGGGPQMPPLIPFSPIMPIYQVNPGPLLKAVNQYPACANLLGGQANATSLINNQNLVNVDNPYVGPTAALSFITSNTIANPLATYMITYPALQTTFYSQNGVNTVGPDATNSLLFHELQHQNNPNAQIDGANMPANINQINQACHTGGIAAPPQITP